MTVCYLFISWFYTVRMYTYGFFQLCFNCIGVRIISNVWSGFLLSFVGRAHWRATCSIDFRSQRKEIWTFGVICVPSTIYKKKNLYLYQITWLTHSRKIFLSFEPEINSGLVKFLTLLSTNSDTFQTRFLSIPDLFLISNIGKWYMVWRNQQKSKKIRKIIHTDEVQNAEKP